jgi:sulfhydrogenase subunit gamma (sulfur reductase)
MSPANPYLPLDARLVEHIQESPTLFTLRLELTDPAAKAAYSFAPGQFNMLYLYGVGEAAISIVSDPTEEHIIDHTIRRLGRVTGGLAELQAGDHIGLRGPFGRGWPVFDAQGRDLVIVTGGLGCAPVVSAIEYVLRRCDEFGRVNIVQGVKHADDFIWRERYDRWAGCPDTKVLIAADEGTPLWPWHVGLVTDLFDQLDFDPANATVMMCGPEGMMRAVAKSMLGMGVPGSDIWLSMERNMQCAAGHCGHCQFGPKFVCKDGPVFSYDQIAELLQIKGL